MTVKAINAKMRQGNLSIIQLSQEIERLEHGTEDRKMYNRVLFPLSLVISGALMWRYPDSAKPIGGSLLATYLVWGAAMLFQDRLSRLRRVRDIHMENII